VRCSFCGIGFGWDYGYRLNATHRLWISGCRAVTIAGVPDPPPDPLCVAFGRRLRALRQHRGLSQEAFALRAGLHRTYVGGIERGERNPSLVNLGRIADALGVSLERLFAGLVAPEAGRPTPPPADT
jgi:DNA-binding XRE family transcriptional regulator